MMIIDFSLMIIENNFHLTRVNNSNLLKRNRELVSLIALILIVNNFLFNKFIIYFG